MLETTNDDAVTLHGASSVRRVSRLRALPCSESTTDYDDAAVQSRAASSANHFSHSGGYIADDDDDEDEDEGDRLSADGSPTSVDASRSNSSEHGHGCRAAAVVSINGLVPEVCLLSTDMSKF